MNPEFEELEKHLEAGPKNGKALQRMGKYYLTHGYYKQAKDEYYLAGLFSPRIVSQIMLDHEILLESNPIDLQARMSLASFCLTTADMDAAMLELEELLDIDPSNLQAYNILGRLYIKFDRIDDAMALLEKALKLEIKDLSISEMLASIYLEKGRLEEAIKFYEELPENKKNLRTLAELYQRREEFNKSAEKYYRMYELDSEVASEVQIKLENLLIKDVSSIKIREFLSLIYTKLLKPDLAVKYLSEILKIAPSKIDEIINKLKQLLKSYPLNPQATLLLAETLAEKGIYSEAVEEYYKLIKNKPDLTDKALEGCRTIIEKYPDQFLGRQFLVETYLAQGKTKEASTEINFLLKTYPESADWIINKCKDLGRKHLDLKECMGYAHLAKGDFQLAASEAESILSSNRQNTSALLLISEIFFRQKLCRKAAEMLHKALEISPYDPIIHEKYHNVRVKELELEAAELKKRIAEDEWKISLHLDLGKNAIARGDREEALRELQAASKDTQRASFSFSLLGNFYRNEGLYDQSLDAFRKALQYCTSESADQQKKIKFGMAFTYEAQGQVRYAVKLLEEIEQEDIDFSGLRAKIKFLKNTNLSSIQNKSLVLIVKNPIDKELLGMWGREAKKSGPKIALAVSFGQNYNSSGIEFLLKGMHQAAEEEFNLSTQLDPHYLAGVNNLAVSQLINKKYSEGLSNLKKAYESEPASPIVLNNLGVALFLNHALVEADIKLSCALELDPELSQAKINLADVRYSNGKVKEALDLYKQIQPSDLVYDLAQQRLLYKIS